MHLGPADPSGKGDGIPDWPIDISAKSLPFSVKRSGTWQIFKKYMLGSNSLLWKDWCWSWSWNPNILATCYEELTHQKRPWCWEKLKVGGKGDDRGWDGWVASPTQWTWAWVSSGHWWWTGKPGMLQSMRSQRVRHDWATELNWTDLLQRTVSHSSKAMF